jgi:hypothetical protein
LKGELSNLELEEEEKKIKFKEKLEKIKRNQTGLSCGSIMNNILKGRTAIVLQNIVLI